MSEHLTLPTSPSSSSVYHYETIPSSFVRSSYENNTQQPVYVSFEPISLYKIQTETLITPSFQRKFPTVCVAMIGFFEFIAGLIVFALEFIIFDVAFGLWCGGIYTIAGATILVLVTCTDRERHQVSFVLIFQLIALIFTIIEIFLYSDLYRKRCLSKLNEPIREFTFHCQIIIIQLTASALVLFCTIIFSIIYFRVTMIVLKQPYGTFNMSNAFNLTTC